MRGQIDIPGGNPHLRDIYRTDLPDGSGHYDEAAGSGDWGWKHHYAVDVADSFGRYDSGDYNRFVKSPDHDFWPLGEGIAFFHSLPEYVEYIYRWAPAGYTGTGGIFDYDDVRSSTMRFAMKVPDANVANSDSEMVARLHCKVPTGTIPSDCLKYSLEQDDVDTDKRYLTPFSRRTSRDVNFEAYQRLRRLQSPYSDGLRVVSAKWSDVVSGSGGRSSDTQAQINDALGGQADADFAAMDVAESGNEVTTGTQQAPATQASGSVSTQCDDGSCTSTQSIEANPVLLSAEVSTVEFNNREVQRTRSTPNDTDRDATDPDTGAATVHSVPPSAAPVPQIDERIAAAAKSGEVYEKLRQPDTDSDVLNLAFDLRGDHRADKLFEIDGLLDGGRPVRYATMPAFGFEPWTYSAYKVAHVNAPQTPAVMPDLETHTPLDAQLFRDPGLNQSLFSDPELRKRPGYVSPSYVFDPLEDHKGYLTPWVPQHWPDGVISNLALANRADPDHDEYYGRAVDLATPPVASQAHHHGLVNIRWPVNLEDLNWYLYALPGEFGEGEWFHWVYPKVRERAARSGFVATAFNPRDYSDSLTAVGEDDKCRFATDVASTAIHCPNPEEKDYFYPFEFQTEYNGHVGRPAYREMEINDLDFLRWGTARAEDAGEVVQGEGWRVLNQFRFRVAEHEPLRELANDTSGRDAERRFGVPRSPQYRQEYLDDYARLVQRTSLDPNRSHLMVVTFYESRNDTSYQVEFSRPGHLVDWRGVFGGDGEDDLNLPKRWLRRVICRVVIAPVGFTGADDEGGNFITRGLKKVVGAIGNLGSWFVNIWKDLFGGFGAIPDAGAKTTMAGACSSVHMFDTLADDGEPGAQTPRPPPGSAGGDGVHVSNTEAQHKKVSQDCNKVTTPDKSVRCDPGATEKSDSCITVPKLQLFVDPRHTEFVAPDRLVEFRRLEYHAPGSSGNQVTSVSASHRGGVVQTGGRVYDLESEVSYFRPLQPSGRFTNWNTGLTRIHLNWDFLWDDETAVLADAIDGYRVRVVPDPQVASDVYTFNVPTYYRVKIDDTSAHGVERSFWTDGLAFGSLSFITDDKGDFAEHLGTLAGRDPLTYPDNPLRSPLPSGPGPSALAEGATHPLMVSALEAVSNPADATPRSYRQTFLDRTLLWDLRSPTVDSFGSVGAGDFLYPGNKEDIASTHRMSVLLRSLPVAPGFVHEFQVQAYVDSLGGERVYGPWSDALTIDGSHAACLAPPENWPAANSVNAVESVRVRENFYQCEGDTAVVLADVSGGFFNSGFGLLGLTGTDLCADLFTVTPAGLTWNNDVVRQVWRFMWILSGGLLFGLFVWHALKLTYDWWIDPQPSGAIREMLPRFLMALALSSTSLFICQFVLTLTADVSCFVAQHTGTTMWSLLGKILLAPLTGLYTWAGNELGLYSWGLALAAIVLFYMYFNIALTIFILFVAFVLYFFIKVLWAMVMRLALLAVLCAVSPLALAMYASDTTSKWPKWWVSCFLGAAFQQVVVLVVLFIGVNFFNGTIGEIGAGIGPIGDLALTFILAMLILALADKVPDLINPNGKGMFSSFGDAFKMAGQLAVAAGVAVATGGAGAIAGGIAGAKGAGTAGDGAPKPDAGGGGSGDAAKSPSGSDTPPNLGTLNRSGNFSGGPDSNTGGESSSTGSQPLSTGTTGGGESGEGGGGQTATSGGGEQEDKRSTPAKIGDALAPDSRSAGALAGARHQTRFGGAAAGVWAGGLRGLKAGFERGRAVNSRMSDIAHGAFLTKHRSTGDDAARQIVESNKIQTDMAKTLKSIDQHLLSSQQGNSGI